ncbi:hypothetical protein WJX73_001728 [Symbiochloris irregularis]|uniref:Uncharacterized protein n=1 Tax=Symbiochloris irregularis TaxID=706552 RepID=A0AAW1NRR5_9CHLO
MILRCFAQRSGPSCVRRPALLPPVTFQHSPRRTWRLSSSEQHAALIQLVPDLEPRLKQLKPELLQQLTSDTALAVKLVSLRTSFPTADVSSMIIKRPSLLTDFSFQVIPAALRTLLEFVPRSQVDALVEVQPWLLDARAGDWLTELKRMLRLTQEDLASCLLKDPDLLFAAQRGTDSLGPGAEYLDS